jgi:uncharacterized protein
MYTTDSILTYTGQYVDLVDPKPESINITDIAHALSQISRFGGHTRTFYSVAQHCVQTSHIVPVRYRLHALLHDAAEAYFGDMVQPLKYLSCCGTYRDHESLMQAHIYDRFGLGMHQADECRDVIRQADLVMLATERRDLMAPESTPWPILVGIEPRAPFIRPLMPQAAESEFLRQFKLLTGTL